jgi:hypothetical protein
MVVCARAALKNFEKVNAQGLVLSELQWAVEAFCFSGGHVGREVSAIPLRRTEESGSSPASVRESLKLRSFLKSRNYSTIITRL